MQKLNFTIILITTINVLGCAGESTVSKLEKNATYSVPKAIGKKRLALIIGNSSYAAVGKLKNPINDAKDLAKALRNLGFEVTKKENVKNSKEMRQLVHDFSNQLRGGGVGIFYYSGHGIQVKGENYLIPTAANLRSEEDIPYETLGMGYVQEALESADNGMNIIILDACRNNPFTRNIRRKNREGAILGLAHMNSAKGSLVAFSTAPDATAEDGSGRNGTYTKHLLANIMKPGLDVEGLFKEVRIGVTEETGGKQTPWESTSLTGDFCFTSCEAPTNKIKILEATAEAEQLRLKAERLKAEEEILKKKKAKIKKQKAKSKKQKNKTKRVANQKR